MCRKREMNIEKGNNRKNNEKEGDIMYEMKSNRNEQYITPYNHKINRAVDL